MGVVMKKSIPNSKYVPRSDLRHVSIEFGHVARLLRDFHNEHYNEITNWLNNNAQYHYSVELVLMEIPANGLRIGELVRQFWFESEEDCFAFKIAWCG